MIQNWSWRNDGHLNIYIYIDIYVYIYICFPVRTLGRWQPRIQIEGWRFLRIKCRGCNPEGTMNFREGDATQGYNFVSRLRNHEFFQHQKKCRVRFLNSVRFHCLGYQYFFDNSNDFNRRNWVFQYILDLPSTQDTSHQDSYIFRLGIPITFAFHH